MKIEISQENLTTTIEAMRDYQLRLENDAAALAGLPGLIPRKLAEDRAKQATVVRGLFEFFVHL